MKAESRTYHVSFLPIIRGAVEPNSTTAVYLLEDALELWDTIVAQTPSAPAPVPDELLSLLPYLIPLLGQDNETLRKALHITDAYLLLAPSSVLSDAFRMALITATGRHDRQSSSRAQQSCDGISSNVRFWLLESLGGEEAVKVVVVDLIRSGFLDKVMRGLRGAWQFHQGTRHPPAKHQIGPSMALSRRITSTSSLASGFRHRLSSSRRFRP